MRMPQRLFGRFLEVFANDDHGFLHGLDLAKHDGEHILAQWGLDFLIVEQKPRGVQPFIDFIIG